MTNYPEQVITTRIKLMRRSQSVSEKRYRHTSPRGVSSLFDVCVSYHIAVNEDQEAFADTNSISMFASLFYALSCAGAGL